MVFSLGSAIFTQCERPERTLIYYLYSKLRVHQRKTYIGCVILVLCCQQSSGLRQALWLVRPSRAIGWHRIPRLRTHSQIIHVFRGLFEGCAPTCQDISITHLISMQVSSQNISGILGSLLPKERIAKAACMGINQRIMFSAN